MSKIKTKDLKSQYLFRVYDEDELNLIKRALEKFKDKFESKNDAIKYFTLIGADKLLNDNMMNNSINFSEIIRYMESINNELELLKNRQKIYFVETNSEILSNQALINFITNVVLKQTGMNLRSYTPEWKYSPHSDYELFNLKNNYKKELLDVRTKDIT